MNYESSPITVGIQQLLGSQVTLLRKSINDMDLIECFMRLFRRKHTKIRP